MKIFYEEVRKFLFRSGGCRIFIVFVLVQAAAVWFLPRDYNYLTWLYKKQYRDYLEIFGGKTSGEKLQRIEAEEENIKKSDEEYAELRRRLEKGEITPEEYDKELPLYDDLGEKSYVFRQIRSQYYSAMCSPKRRYVMDENGWYAAMQDVGLNIFPILCVLFVAVRIFCPEYESGMYALVSCADNGKTKTVLSKLVLVLLAAVFCAFVSATMLLLASQVKFGLGPAGYPLQSLSYFSGCNYHISIGKGFGVIWCLKASALGLTGLAASAFCCLFKKSVPAFFISTLTGILPYYLFDLEVLLKYIPHLGLFLSEYYFCGIERTNVQTQMTEYVSIPFRNLLGVCLGGGLLAVLFALTAVRIWNHRLKKGGCVMSNKKFFLALFTFSCVFICASCTVGKKGSGDLRFFYNGQPAAAGGLCSGGGYLYDCTKNIARMYRLDDGAEYDFIRDPFFEENPDAAPVRYIFPGEDFLYYMEDTNGSSFRIVRRDYETFAEKTVYSKVYRKEQRELFLGAAESIPSFSRDFLNPPQPGQFCVFENVLFLFYDQRVERMDLNTKKISVISKRGISAGNYAYGQGKLYWIGTDYSLYSYHIAEDRMRLFEGVKASCLLVTPQGIFYANANDGARLYVMDFDGGGRHKLADTAVTSMDFFKDQLYYLSAREDEGSVYSMNFDGSHAQVLLNRPQSFALLCVGEKQRLYVVYTDETGEPILELHEISSAELDVACGSVPVQNTLHAVKKTGHDVIEMVKKTLKMSFSCNDEYSL